MRWDCKQRGECYLDKHMPNWGFLKGAFPRGIEPTDLDGWVEINRHFLTLEWKGCDANLTGGQDMAFTRRAESKSDAVFVLWGDAEKTEAVAMQRIWNGRKGEKFSATNDLVYHYCERWSAWAESGGDTVVSLSDKYPHLRNSHTPTIESDL